MSKERNTASNTINSIFSAISIQNNSDYYLKGFYFRNKKEISLEERNDKGDTLLLASIKANRYYLTKFFIKMGANLKARNNQGLGALDIAAQMNNIEILRFLFKYNPEQEAINQAFLFGAVQNNVKVLRFLLGKNADINFKLEKDNEEQPTALHLATKYKHEDAIRFLCLNGVDYNKKDKEGRLAFDPENKAASSFSIFNSYANKNIKFIKKLQSEIDRLEKDKGTTYNRWRYDKKIGEYVRVEVKNYVPDNKVIALKKLKKLAENHLFKPTAKIVYCWKNLENGIYYEAVKKHNPVKFNFLGLITPTSQKFVEHYEGNKKQIMNPKL